MYCSGEGKMPENNISVRELPYPLVIFNPHLVCYTPQKFQGGGIARQKKILSSPRGFHEWISLVSFAEGF